MESSKGFVILPFLIGIFVVLAGATVILLSQSRVSPEVLGTVSLPIIETENPENIIQQEQIVNDDETLINRLDTVNLSPQQGPISRDSFLGKIIHSEFGDFLKKFFSLGN